MNKEEAIQKLKRDEHGLLKNFVYTYNEDGTINWRAMIKPEFLVPKNGASGDVSSLKDNELLILLGGIRDLAKIRGYTNVSYELNTSSVDYVSAICTIEWIPNFETEMRPVSFSGMACTHTNNTEDFTQDYLVEMAENRAFVRAVRNFLNIGICGKDEVSSKKRTKSSEENSGEQSSIDGLPASDPRVAIFKALQNSKEGLTLDYIKTKLIEEGHETAHTWESFKDIPKSEAFNVLKRIKIKSK